VAEHTHSPLNGMTQSVNMEEEGPSPTMDRRSLRKNPLLIYV